MSGVFNTNVGVFPRKSSSYIGLTVNLRGVTGCKPSLTSSADGMFHFHQDLTISSQLLKTAERVQNKFELSSSTHVTSSEERFVRAEPVLVRAGQSCDRTRGTCWRKCWKHISHFVNKSQFCALVLFLEICPSALWNLAGWFYICSVVLSLITFHSLPLLNKMSNKPEWVFGKWRVILSGVTGAVNFSPSVTERLQPPVARPGPEWLCSVDGCKVTECIPPPLSSPTTLHLPPPHTHTHPHNHYETPADGQETKGVWGWEAPTSSNAPSPPHFS